MQRWSRTARWATHGGMGALTGVATGWSVTRAGALADPEDPDAPPASPGGARVAALAVLAGAATVGLSRGGEAADTWVERRLADRGVRRPRLWMGIAAGGVSLAMSAVDRRRAATRASVGD